MGMATSRTIIIIIKGLNCSSDIWDAYKVAKTSFIISLILNSKQHLKTVESIVQQLPREVWMFEEVRGQYRRPKGLCFVNFYSCFAIEAISKLIQMWFHNGSTSWFYIFEIEQFKQQLTLENSYFIFFFFFRFKVILRYLNSFYLQKQYTLVFGIKLFRTNDRIPSERN